MGLILEYCEDADMQRVFGIMSEAFIGEPYIDALFPDHTTPLGRIVGGKRLLLSKQTEKNATFLKVTDTTTGTIIGQAKWLIFEQPAGDEKPEEAPLSGDYWATDEDKEYAAYLYAQYTVRRKQAISSRKGPLIALDLLTVDPIHQSRGAGTMLLKWGTELGDRMGAEMIVEGAVTARKLYERFGYQALEDVTMTVPEKWSGRPMQRYLWLRRPVTKATCST